MAEGVGFEPTIRLPVYTLSKRAPSATRPSLRSLAVRERPALRQAGREYRCRPSERKRLGIATLVGPRRCPASAGRPRRREEPTGASPGPSASCPSVAQPDIAHTRASRHVARPAQRSGAVAVRALRRLTAASAARWVPRDSRAVSTASSGSLHAAVAAPQSLCIVGLASARPTRRGAPTGSTSARGCHAGFLSLPGGHLPADRGDRRGV